MSDHKGDDHSEPWYPPGSSEHGKSASQPHANRPKLLFDEESNTHYLIAHFRGGELSDPVLFAIKHRAAQWVKGKGVDVGNVLPEGMLGDLFDTGGLYPKPGWKPKEAKPIPISELDKNDDGLWGAIGCLTIVCIILAVILGVMIF